MNTFLASPEVSDLRWLDSVRLNNQMNECKVMQRALLHKSQAWAHHPAVVMWRGHEGAFARYMLAIGIEMRRRGIKISDEALRSIDATVSPQCVSPWPSWFGCELFFTQHRANLVRKNTAHYRMYFSEDPSDWYVWPVREGDVWILRRKTVGAKKYDAPIGEMSAYVE